MHITCKQMRLFLAFSDKLSETNASQKMCITQPTVSIQLKKFEVINIKVLLSEMIEKLEIDFMHLKEQTHCI